MDTSVKIVREIVVFDAEDVVMERLIDYIDEFFCDTLHDFEDNFKFVCSADDYTRIIQACAMKLIDELGKVYGIDIEGISPKPHL